MGGTPTRSTSLWGMSNRGKYVQTLPAAPTTQEEMPADGMCRQLGLKGPGGRRERVCELGRAQEMWGEIQGMGFQTSNPFLLLPLSPLAMQLLLLFQNEKHNFCCYPD